MTAPPPGQFGPPPGWPGHAPSWGPGYASPPGYPAGQHPPLAPLWQPGVIPLRPLSLSDIFNGAVGYVRSHPKPTLGLTTCIVLITTVIGFFTGLAATRIEGDLSALAGPVAGATATLLATTVLSGMLTVIVARSVLGAQITVSEAWHRVRGRMPALIALTLLEIAAVAAVVAAVVVVIYGVARAASAAVATLVGIPLVLGLIAALAYLYVTLALAPVAIVLENKRVTSAIRRSFALSNRRFWRMLGILLLAGVVAKLVGMAVSVPFDIAGQVLTFGPSAVTAVAVTTIGTAIGGIITTPFIAGVVALLYVDARIRSEAFDFTLLATPHVDADSAWIPR